MHILLNDFQSVRVAENDQCTGTKGTKVRVSEHSRQEIRRISLVDKHIYCYGSIDNPKTARTNPTFSLVCALISGIHEQGMGGPLTNGTFCQRQSRRGAKTPLASVVNFYVMLRLARAFAFISSSAIISFMLTGLLGFAVFLFAWLLVPVAPCWCFGGGGGGGGSGGGWMLASIEKTGSAG